MLERRRATHRSSNAMAAATVSEQQKREKKQRRLLEQQQQQERVGKERPTKDEHVRRSSDATSEGSILKSTGVRRVTRDENVSCHPSVHTNKKSRREHESSKGEHARAAIIDGTERTDIVKELGDDINTRLRDIVFDDDLDNDVFDERRRELLEDARLAAGTQQRIVSTAMSQLMRTNRAGSTRTSTALSATGEDAESGLSILRVRHNANAVTAVACLGSDLVAFGDKSGRVYLADWSSPSSSSSSSGSALGKNNDVNNSKRKHVSQSVADQSLANQAANADALLSRRKIALEPALASAVTSIALSDTRHRRPTTRDLLEKSTVDMSCVSYLAVGSNDGSIAVWETHTRQYKGLLSMHHKPVTGLCFRLNTSTLLSCSVDSTLRVWSVAQMMCNDKLYGHTGTIAGVHTLRRETCATVGEDGTMRFWKLDTAMQQGYEYLRQHREAAAILAETASAINDGQTANGASATRTVSDATMRSSQKSSDRSRIALTSVAMLNESIIVAGAVDGSVLVFDVNRRKPLLTHLAAHGYGFVGDGTGLEKTPVRVRESVQTDGVDAHGAQAAAAEHAHLINTDGSSSNAGGSTFCEEDDSKGRVGQGNDGDDAHTAVRRDSLRSGHPAIASSTRRNANPITAVAAVSYGDVVASASYDGRVRLWQLSGVGSGTAIAGRPADAEDAVERNTAHAKTSTPGVAACNKSLPHARPKDQPQLTAITDIPIEALVTSLIFSDAGDVLCVGCSKEPRDGRWVVMRSALNSVCVVPLTQSAVNKLQQTGGCIEHVPTLLYGETAQSNANSEAEEEHDESADAATEEEEEEDEYMTEEVDSDVAGTGEGEQNASILKQGADGQLVLDDRVLAMKGMTSVKDADAISARVGAAQNGKTAKKSNKDKKRARVVAGDATSKVKVTKGDLSNAFSSASSSVDVGPSMLSIRKKKSKREQNGGKDDANSSTVSKTKRAKKDKNAGTLKKK